MSFKFSRILSVSALLISFFIVPLPAKAEKVCQVTDPTGTPLNVRVTPNGKIINTLKNGREVNVEEIAYDSQGRPWAKVSGYYKDRYRVWGWVFREFISCYDRKTF